MKKITIIDGYSLLFRAYFATSFPGMEIMHNQDGVPTNAIFAFSNMINKIISSIKEEECLFVALDTTGVTFRKQALESYKANRKPCPDDLKIQFPIVRDFLKSLGIYQYEKEGYEGDDIAGTVAKLAEKEGYKVEIYTSDKDYLQLVSENVTVNLIRKGLSDIVPMTPQKVIEDLGFTPIQIIDYKGLRGDSSDNLPGIPGIGEKTAVKLIQDYGSFDSIISAADTIKGKLGENIKLNAEEGRLCRNLAIIKTDIELPFDIIDTTYKGYDFNEINMFCQKYGLKQFINKVNPKWKKASLSNLEIKYQIVSSFKDIKIDDDIGIALDYDGDYSNETPIGIAISNKDNCYYIDFENVSKDETLIQILKNDKIKKYCFDYKAIKVCLSRNNINIVGVKFDILLASYLLDSSLSSNLDQVMNMFGIDLTVNENVDIFATNNPKRTTKAAFYCLNLYPNVKKELEEKEAFSLLENLEIPLCDTLANMEIEGFPIDVNVLNELGKEYKTHIDSLSEQIYSLAGEQFNIASPKQVGEILYTKLGLSSNKKMSTSIDDLKYIINEHPIVNLILEYRKYSKLLSTYVEGLKPYIYKDNKIHAHFNQALTTTGRLSSSNPNLQNISIRDEEGKAIRKAFFYPNNEYEILSLDYSQIELRILAYLSKCQKLIDVFKNNIDIHTATAKAVFHIDGQPTSNQRRKAKAVNFGIIYGISDWGLADQIDVSNKEAREIINEFYKNYPEIGLFFNNIVEEAKEKGYVSTLSGRRRYLREIYDANYQVREFAKRAAMNAPIQGSAADLIKIAMIKVEKALKDNNLKTKMVLQIHDELIFKVPKEEKEIVYNLVKNIMEHAIDIDVPLLVDGGFGNSWFSCK